jgi:hypothetical protein
VVVAAKSPSPTHPAHLPPHPTPARTGHPHSTPIKCMYRNRQAGSKVGSGGVGEHLGAGEVARGGSWWLWSLKKPTFPCPNNARPQAHQVPPMPAATHNYSKPSSSSRGGRHRGRSSWRGAHGIGWPLALPTGSVREGSSGYGQLGTPVGWLVLGAPCCPRQYTRICMPRTLAGPSTLHRHVIISILDAPVDGRVRKQAAHVPNPCPTGGDTHTGTATGSGSVAVAGWQRSGSGSTLQPRLPLVEHRVITSPTMPGMAESAWTALGGE